MRHSRRSEHCSTGERGHGVEPTRSVTDAGHQREHGDVQDPQQRSANFSDGSTDACSFMGDLRSPCVGRTANGSADEPCGSTSSSSTRRSRHIRGALPPWRPAAGPRNRPAGATTLPVRSRRRGTPAGRRARRPTEPAHRLHSSFRLEHDQRTSQHTALQQKAPSPDWALVVTPGSLMGQGGAAAA